MIKNIIIGLLVAIIALIVLFPRLHTLKSVEEIEIMNSHWLRQIAANALETKDYPIGAILYYEDEVIGEGNHTVLKNNDPSGHAILNALRDAAENMGMKNFEKLDRSKLIVYSTYEPCDMCKGALINNNIENVHFLMSKKFKNYWQDYKQGFSYEWNKQNAGREYIQDSLFVIHPKYPFIP